MGNKVALVVGNTRYAAPQLGALVAPAADVQHLCDLIADPDIGGFNEVVSLVDVSIAQMQRDMARFFVHRRPDDMLLIYFSGHGILDVDGKLYLAATDTETDILRATALPASYLSEDMRRCGVSQQLLILDCCHSGAFDRTKRALGTSVGTESIFGGTGQIVLTASDALQVALDGSVQSGQITPSLFTKHMLRGLESCAADLNHDGYISIDELYEYTYGKVIAESGGQQTPLKIGKQKGVFVVARNRFAAAANKVLDPRQKRAAEIVQHAYQDWEIFDRSKHRLLSSEDLDVLYEFGDAVFMDSRMLVFVLLSIATKRSLSQAGSQRIRQWLTAVEPAAANQVFAATLNQLSDREISWLLKRMVTLKLDTVIPVVFDLVVHEKSAEIASHAAAAVWSMGAQLPPEIADKVLIFTLESC